MGKKRSLPIPETSLILPIHPAYQNLATEGQQQQEQQHFPPIIDTHGHLVHAFGSYRNKYKQGSYETIHDFVRGYYPRSTSQPQVTKLVDVWCEAPVSTAWKEVANSALTPEQREKDWGGVEYWFVIGVHPHDAKSYTDQVESDLLDAIKHPRCVGMGEMGLDYHYDNSPRDIQQQVLIRQLKLTINANLPLTIHTREADSDTERILKEHVPKDHRIHVHCFTDSPDLAQSLLDHFPNLYIGITGVVTYASNLNTKTVIQNMIKNAQSNVKAQERSPLRILLETDKPYMAPSNLDASTLGLKTGQRLPFSHSGMIPYTAQFVAESANSVLPEGVQPFTVSDILEIGAHNAEHMYSI